MDTTTLDRQIINNRMFRKEIAEFIGFREEDILEYKSNRDKKIYSIKRHSLKEIRVAAIMDRFTYECFEPECVLLQLTPVDWKNEIKSFNPDLLFIESAWRGKNELWKGKVNHCAKELQDLTDYCHENNIPIVFWNKEDPIYTDTFMPTARRADFIFTTDIDCIQKYKTQCNHSRVYHLHFGAQPKIHNPIEKFDRKDKLCFAGAYYTRYPERSRVFNDFAEYFIENKGLDIYDRNYNDPESEYKFPDFYKPYILGCLDPSDIDVAYKGYTFGVNMNSVNQSQTMFARRVFELLASNTVVVGNYSRGVKNYFGDLTICTNDKDTLKKNVHEYCNDKDTLDKYRLLGLRKVISEHLMEDRFRYIVNKITNDAFVKRMPRVIVLGIVHSQQEADAVLESYMRQRYLAKRLIICPIGFDVQQNYSHNITIKSEDELTDEFSECEFIAYFAGSDWYGENYLTDLVLATRYTSNDVYCKDMHFTYKDGHAALNGEGCEYKEVSEATLRGAIVAREIFSNICISDISEDMKLSKYTKSIFSIDRFNYCKDLPLQTACAEAEDLNICDSGLSMESIDSISEKITIRRLDNYSKCIDAEELCELNTKGDLRISLKKQNGKVRLESTLPADEHVYYYIEKNISFGEYIQDGKLTVVFNGESTMNIMGCVMLLNNKREKIDIKTIALNRKLEFENISEDAVYIRVGFRIKESGYANLSDILIGRNYNSSLINGCFLSRSNTLVLTNHYPSAKELYKNAFVQTRILGYKSEGHLVDVMRMYPYSENGFREYNGINITEGHEDVLDSILDSSQINTICVHFLDYDMWKILKGHINDVRLIIWSHGADIKPWWRREFNYSVETISKGKEQSKHRMALWKEVFECAKKFDIRFVFVSKSFADEVMEDYGLEEGDIDYEIIHNFIDTEKFKFENKEPEQRKNILTIKSFSSPKYGNDLTTNAIVELSKREFFKDLHFDIYGMGDLFDDVNKPLQKYKNVSLHNEFLTQEQILNCHKTHGVYIATTRSDTQGVSRDEAMSSGLVPIANAVTAIPEFVDEESGYLVPDENYIGIADAIEEMYFNPDIFIGKSAAAARKVRSLSDKQKTIEQEIRLIFSI